MSLLSRKHVYSGTTSKKNGLDKINDKSKNAFWTLNSFYIV